jgi:2-polyprenyl-6-hydroxyphenyl methylase/3-demethylubiquinone-9 3-methyltransferase
MVDAAEEIRHGERFAFGRNWTEFLETLDETRVEAAVSGLKTGLGVESLHGTRFLDAGSGSGLSSLAAHRLGATVHSFDYDLDSVACTRELRRRESAADDDWVVEQGSVLDAGYLASLGQFDIVYSWGVLHHTGDMWLACALVAPLVRPGRTLWLAIYNDQGGATRRWRAVKRAYNRAPRRLRPAIVGVVGGFFELRTSVIQAVRLQNPFTRPSGMNERGMSRTNDLVDWVGGWPFEVARPEEVFAFYRTRGFTLERLKTVAGGLGCNEYVFTAPR